MNKVLIAILVKEDRVNYMIKLVKIFKKLKEIKINKITLIRRCKCKI